MMIHKHGFIMILLYRNCKGMLFLTTAFTKFSKTILFLFKRHIENI